MINVSSVVFDESVEQEVLAVLRSGMIAQGPKVLELERLFAEIVGVPHAIAVNNGTTALVAALKMSELEPGSEVVTSPFTFVATLNAALEAGLNVRFADIDEHTFNVTANTMSDASTTRTSCLLPVHLYGQCADMEGIGSLSKSRGWMLIEDAAQAHGATHNGQQAGSFGTGCFSFYATKNVTTGEGGMITTSDDQLADRLRVYRNQGMRARYQYEMQGANYRLTDLQAAIGVPQLRNLDDIISRRKKNAAYLLERLSSVEELFLPATDNENSHVWHQFTVRINEKSKRSRNEVIEQLAANGIGSGIYYPRLAHDYDCFRNDPRIDTGETPIARRVVNEVLSIPVHQHLSEMDLELVATNLMNAVQS
jgi:dTDP-4-amino-4,6-dideoxygalactose transaminase